MQESTADLPEVLKLGLRLVGSLTQYRHFYISAMVSVNCQLDRLRNRPRETLLSTRVQCYLGQSLGTLVESYLEEVHGMKTVAVSIIRWAENLGYRRWRRRARPSFLPVPQFYVRCDQLLQTPGTVISPPLVLEP